MKHGMYLMLTLHVASRLVALEAEYFSSDRTYNQKESRNNAQKESRLREIGNVRRNEFEDALKTAFERRRKNPKLERTKSLKEAKEIWQRFQKSSQPAREFVPPLKDRYEGTIHDIYSGISNDSARAEFEADLQEIDPFLYRTWRNSFFKNRGTNKGEVRTDISFFSWLNENPQYLISPQKEHELTPLEIACNNNSKEMAEKVLYIAEEHNIGINELIKPLVEQYKILYKDYGSQVAHNYLKSIYKLDVHQISSALFDSINEITF